MNQKEKKKRERERASGRGTVRERGGEARKRETGKGRATDGNQYFEDENDNDRYGSDCGGRPVDIRGETSSNPFRIRKQMGAERRRHDGGKKEK